MIQFINRVTTIIFIASGLISFVLYHEDMDLDIPYINTIMIGITLALLFLLIIKILYRWQGLAIARKAKLFYTISDLGFRKIATHELIRIGFYLVLTIGFIAYSSLGFYIGIISGAFLLETLLHLLSNLRNKHYKTIIQENAITIINTEVKVIPWNDLKRIELRYNDLRFIDQLDNISRIDLDIIKFDDRKNLIQDLKRIALEKKLFFDVPEAYS